MVLQIWILATFILNYVVNSLSQSATGLGNGGGGGDGKLGGKEHDLTFYYDIHPRARPGTAYDNYEDGN